MKGKDGDFGLDGASDEAGVVGLVVHPRHLFRAGDLSPPKLILGRSVIRVMARRPSAFFSRIPTASSR